MWRKSRKREFYTQLAHKEGYPARSVYKLKEIDERFHLLKRGDKVLDLGSAPGSWILYLARKVGSRGRVLGFDLEEIKIPLPSNVIFFQKDIAVLGKADFREKFQAVVADLSPKTSGISEIDVSRSLELSMNAFEIARAVLKKGGNFVCKIFETETTAAFFKEVETSFKYTKRFRPKAVMKGSREFYIVAKGFLPPIDKIE